MNPKHAIFATRDAALNAARDGLTRIETQLTEAATAALPADEAANAGPSPLVVGRVISAAALPAGALSLTAPAFSEVVWEIITSDGKIEQVKSRIPTADLPPPTKTTGVITALTTTKPTVRVQASLPVAVQVYAHTAGGTFPLGGEMVDPISGKRWECSLAVAAMPVGVNEIPVIEVSSSELGEVTHGSQLIVTAPIAQILPTATVLTMFGATVPAASIAYDEAGRKFKVDTVTLSSVSKLGGTTVATATFIRDPTDPLYLAGDTESLAAGSTLTFSPLLSGVAAIATTLTAATKTIPANSPLLRVGISFVVTEDTDITDSMTGPVPFRAVLASVTSDVVAGDTLTFTPAISGVTAGALVLSAQGAVLYPQIPFPPQIVGAELEFRADVRAEIYGGQWSATIQPEMDVDG